MSLKALIFDFDGLILDTESPELAAWQRFYAQEGQRLDLDIWGQIVGGDGVSGFNPVSYLESLTGRTYPAAAVREQVHAWAWEQLSRQDVLPGVRDLLASARDEGLKLAVASSSSHAWVDGHLARLGLEAFFDVVVCREDVAQAKPHPDLFLLAARRLGVSPNEVIVLEDSPNGVQAAKNAGMFVIAVPNSVTLGLKFNQPDKSLSTLQDVSPGMLKDWFAS